MIIYFACLDYCALHMSTLRMFFWCSDLVMIKFIWFILSGFDSYLFQAVGNCGPVEFRASSPVRAAWTQTCWVRLHTTQSMLKPPFILMVPLLCVVQVTMPAAVILSVTDPRWTSRRDRCRSCLISGSSSGFIRTEWRFSLTPGTAAETRSGYSIQCI